MHRVTRFASTSQQGGTILGYGKRSTLVYTVEDLLKYLPRVLKICVASFAVNRRRPPPRCIYGGTISVESKLMNDEALQSIAIKDCGESPKAMSAVVGEVSWNQKVHKWFSQANALALTSLHSHTSHLEVMHRRAPTQTSFRTTNRVQTMSKEATTILNNKSSDRVSNPLSTTIQKRILPVYRECDGSLVDLNIMRRMKENELLQMSKRVLEFLVLLHSKQHIHMDVKPDNILFTFNDTTGTHDFCLSDYETLENATQVAARVKRKGEFPQGTNGFMSPLLTLDDTENKVYHLFSAVAKVCAGVDVSTSEFGKVIRTAKMDISLHIYKADLHSLALTLLNIILPDSLLSGHDGKHDGVRVMRTSLKQFPRIRTLLPRLMFFDKSNELQDAASALAAVMALMQR